MHTRYLYIHRNSTAEIANKLKIIIMKKKSITYYYASTFGLTSHDCYKLRRRFLVISYSAPGLCRYISLNPFILQLTIVCRTYSIYCIYN